MSKAFEQLSRDLANGISRRKAFWGFLATGAGGVLGSATVASACTNGIQCGAYCDELAIGLEQSILGLCNSRARICAPGTCPHPGYTLTINGNSIKFGSSSYDLFQGCTPVSNCGV